MDRKQRLKVLLPIVIDDLTEFAETSEAQGYAGPLRTALNQLCVVEQYVKGVQVVREVPPFKQLLSEANKEGNEVLHSEMQGMYQGPAQGTMEIQTRATPTGTEVEGASEVSPEDCEVQSEEERNPFCTGC